MSHNIPEWVYILFTAVTALGVVLQAGALLGMLFALKGSLKRVDEISKKAEEIAVPAFESTRDLLKDVAPKLKVAAQNLLEVSETAKEVSNTVRAESTQLAVALNDVMARASVQVERVDEMVTGTLSSVAHATATLQKAVSGPARQVGALLSGLRAGFDVLRKKDVEVHASADGDHFV
jgi:methyl-accepting chemotaxis protein